MKQEDEIKALNREIQNQNSCIKLLREKITLEEQLVAVRIKIIKRCVNSACVQRYRCEARISELENPHAHQLLPKRYKKDADKIFAIIKQSGNDRRAIVEELKKAGIIAKSTYWKDVGFLKSLIKK